MKSNQIDLSDYIKKFNEEGVGANKAGGTAIFDKLKALSVRLCSEIDNLYPIADPKTGQIISESPENLCLSASLILSGLLGWNSKSKSISHYNTPRPEQEVFLIRQVMPSIIDAYGQGIQKAISNKSGNGRVPKSNTEKRKGRVT